MREIRFEKLKHFKYELSTYAIIIIGFLFVQFLKYTNNISSLLEGLLIPFCIYSILAISLNIIIGINGELSLGHAGFMCLGAFSSAIFTRYLKFLGAENLYFFIISIFIGAFNAGIVAFFIGIPILKLKGDYFAIVTLAFGEIVKNIFGSIYLGFDNKGFHTSFKSAFDLHLEKNGFIIIKGPQGIIDIPNYSTFFISTFILLIIVFITLNLINSRDGRNMMALRDNRIAGESIGINPLKYKLSAFVIASAMAGVAGVLYAHNLSTLTANSKNFGYNMSITILILVIFGRIGNIRGSIISAIILTLLPEILRFLQDYRMLIYSIVLIFVMLITSAPNFIKYRNFLINKFTYKSIKKYFIKRKIKNRIKERNEK